MRMVLSWLSALARAASAVSIAASAAGAGEIAQFLHRLARLRPPALGGDPAERAALPYASESLHQDPDLIPNR